MKEIVLDRYDISQQLDINIVVSMSRQCLKIFKKVLKKVLTSSTKYAIINEVFREGRQIKKILYIEK